MVVNYLKSLDELDGLTFPKNTMFLLKIVGGNDSFHPKITGPVISIFSVGRDNIYVVNHLHDEYYKIRSEDFFYKLSEKIRENKSNFIVDFKKSLHYFSGFLDLSFHDREVYNYSHNGIIPEDRKYEDSFFYKDRNSAGLNIIIPISKHIEEFRKTLTEHLSQEYTGLYEPGYLSLLRRIIPFLFNIEKHGLCIDNDRFKEHFGYEKLRYTRDNLLYNSYNIFSATGRPSNSIHGINFAALHKADGQRKIITSRFGNDGMLVLFDFKAYHPHLLGKLTNFTFPEFTDLYVWLTGEMAKISTEKQESLKGEVFTQLYGHIDKKYLPIPFYKTVDEFIKNRWVYFRNNGYVDTPIFSRSISDKHLDSPNPNKVTNYILQAYETERNCIVMENLYTFLANKVTIPILYGYDSILFDFNKTDGKDCLIGINNLMTDGGFKVSIKVGHNFDEMVKIELIDAISNNS